MSVIKKVLATILIVMMLLNNMSMLIVYAVDNINNTQNVTDESKLSSTKYIISEEENVIKRVLPETKVGVFKGKFNMPKNYVKIYRNKQKQEEVNDEEYITTGMIMEYEGSSKTYDVSVIGDLNNDGMMDAIELNLLIKEILGMQNIEGLYDESADINGDGVINQIDITVLIRWVVYHELEIPEVEMPEAPNINVIEGEQGENNWYKSNVTVEIRQEDEQIDLEKITYTLSKKPNDENGQEQILANEEEIESGDVIELQEEGIYEIKAYSYSTAGQRSVENVKEIKIEKGIEKAELSVTKVITNKIEVKVEAKSLSGIAEYVYYLGKYEEVEDQESEAGSTTGSKSTEGEKGTGEDSTQGGESEEVQGNTKKQEVVYGEGITSKENTHEFVGLDQETEYVIKVEVKSNAGNVLEKLEQRTTAKMPSLVEADVELVGNTEDWTNQNVQAEIKVNEEKNPNGSYEVEYKIGEGQWEKYTGLIEVEQNGEVKVRLTDGENYSNEVTKEITNIDKQNPEGRIEVTKTTKEIKVQVKDAKDDQSGIISYTYYIGVKNEQGEYEYTKVKEYIELDGEVNEEEASKKLECTYERLKQDVEYRVVVEIKDVAGNVNRIEQPVRTNKMPKIRVSDIEINYSETEWTNENVEVTIKVRDGVDVGECVLEYSLDGGKTWKTYEEEVKVEIGENTNIIVRLTDGVNEMEVATGRVSNIDKENPEGSLKVKIARSNRIVVEAEGMDYISGVKSFTYYIGTKNEQGVIEYVEYSRQEKDLTPRERLKEEYTYENLNKSTTYYVKLEIEDNAGNKIELYGEATTQKVPALTDENTKFEVSEDGWTGDDVVVKVEVDEDIDQDEYHLEYSTDGGQTWHEYDPETGIVVEENTDVDVRLSDGTNSGEEKSIEVNNIDKTAPEVRITKKEATSSTITVEVEAVEEQSGIEKYVYYLGRKTASEEIEYQKYAETMETTYVYTDLDQNTDYYIKVEVVDKVGNVGEALDTIKTLRIPDGRDIITLTQDRKRWTNGNVTVTIEYEKTVYDVEYTIDGENWVKSTHSGERIIIEENTTVYARLTDGRNVGESTSLEITNIDKIIPVIESYDVIDIKSDGFTEELHITDNLSGISNITWYIRPYGESQFSESKETFTIQEGLDAGEQDVTKQKQYKGLKTGTYEVYAQIFDVSGNKVETEVKTIALKPVEELTEENSNIILIPKTWTNQDIQVLIETEIEGYSIEYSFDGKNYNKYIDGVGVKVSQNGEIYARLTDGVNVGKATSKKITNIDKVDPEVGEIEAVEVTSKRIRASIEMQDVLSGLGKIDWYYKHVENDEYIKKEIIYTPLNGSETGSRDQVTEILDLNEIKSGVYSIYAQVFDVAGNMVQSPVIVIETLYVPGKEALTMTQTPTTWTNNEVTVSMTIASGITGYYVEYSTDGGKNWTKGNSVTVGENITVHARLTDGVNKGESSSLTVSNIDKTPVVAGKIVTKNVTSNSLTAQIEVQDELSGLGKIEWFYKHSTDGDYTKEEQIYQTLNGANDGTTEKVTKELVLKNIKAGAYEIYAKVYDVAGNVITVATITQSTVVIPTGDNALTMIASPTTWTNENVVVSLTSKVPGYTVQYSTDGTTYTSGISVEIDSNKKVYGRLTDGVNNGEPKVITIGNIDKQEPTVGTITAKTTTTRGITAMVTVEDTLSGLGKIEWFYRKQGETNYTKVTQEYQKLKGEEKGEVTSVTKELVMENLSSGNYDIYVKVYDVAGNVKESSKVVLTTASIPDGTTAITIDKTPTTWTHEEVTVTFGLKSGITGYNIEYSTDNTNWQLGTTVKVDVNKTVYARLTDGINPGKETSTIIDNIDTQKPSLKNIEIKAKTSKSITAELKMQDTLSGIGKIEWYYKHTDDEEYIKRDELCQALNGSVAGDRTEVAKTLTLTNIKAGTYSIYAKVFDVAGNVIESGATVADTVKIPSAEEAFTMVATPTTWTKDSVTVTMTLNPGITGYNIEYSTNGGKDWIKGNSVTVASNVTVYARLEDGVNKGESKNIKITNIDKIPASIGTIVVKNIATNTITAQIEVQDTLSGLGKIEWYYKHSSDEGYTKEEQVYQTLNGENAGSVGKEIKELVLENIRSGSYSIYAKVYDVAGNEKEATAITPSTVPLPSGEEALTMIPSPNYWTNENVIVSLTSNAAGYVTQYSTDGNTYKTGTSVEIDSNKKVYGRLTDGLNSGTPKTIDIGNIDKQQPTVGNITAKATTTKTITAQVAVQDTLSGLAKVEWYYKKQGQANYTKVIQEDKVIHETTKGNTASVTKELLIENLSSGTYEIYVKVYDVAGNVKTSATANLTTSAMPTGNASITMSKNPTNWTNKEVTVTIGLAGGVTGYTTEYSTDNVNYQAGTSVKVDSNKTVYARLTDGINTGEAKTLVVDNIDTEDPTIHSIQIASRTSKTITANITAQDTLSGLGKIEWNYKHSDDANYKKEEISLQQLNGPTPGSTDSVTKALNLNNIKSGTYSIYAKVYDVAGNVKQSETILIETTPIPSGEGAFTMTASPTTWTNSPVTVTMQSKVSGYNIEYSINGTSSWSGGTSESATASMQSNGTIHARLTDGLNKGESKSLNIENIDTVRPEAGNITEVSKTSNKIVASLNVKDTLSGLAKVEWYYKKSDASGYMTKVEEWQTMHGNARGDTVTKVSQLVLENLTSGTYNIYAYVYDVAGNRTDVAQANIATKAIPTLTEGANLTFSHTPESWTKDNVTVSISTTDREYTLEYSTDGRNWSKYIGPIIVSQNGPIHARLTDGANVGVAASTTISNIDKQPPTIGSVSGSSAVGNVGTITVSGIADSQSGIGAISITKARGTYEWVNTNASSYTKQVEGEASNGTWYVYVRDVAGNVSSEPKEVTVSGVKERVKDFYLSTQNISLYIGDTGTIQINYNGEARSVAYTSDSSGIAQVTAQNGKTATIRGVAEGITNIRITVTNYDGSTIGATASVTVERRNTAPKIASMSFVEKGTNYITVKTRATDADGDRLSYVLKVGTSASNLSIVSDAKEAAQGQEVNITVNGLAEYTDYYYEVEVADIWNEKDRKASSGSVRTYCPGTGLTCNEATKELCSVCKGTGSVNKRCSMSAGFSTVKTGFTAYGCIVCGHQFDTFNIICNACGQVVGGGVDGCPHIPGSSHGPSAHNVGTEDCTNCTDGYVVKPCEHGETISHNYCKHNRTVMHDD